MIQGYGLQVGVGGINPQILLDLVNRQRKMGRTASARDLVRAIEEVIANSLIDAKRKGAQRVALAERNGRVDRDHPIKPPRPVGLARSFRW